MLCIMEQPIPPSNMPNSLVQAAIPLGANGFF
jgi:hypothetical protein